MKRIFRLSIQLGLLLLFSAVPVLLFAQNAKMQTLEDVLFYPKVRSGARSAYHDGLSGFVPIGRNDFIAYGSFESNEKNPKVILGERAEIPGYSEDCWQPSSSTVDPRTESGYVARLAADGSVRWYISSVDGKIASIKAAVEGENTYVFLQVEHVNRLFRSKDDKILTVWRHQNGQEWSVEEELQTPKSPCGEDFRAKGFIYVLKLGPNGEFLDAQEIITGELLSKRTHWFVLYDFAVRKGNYTVVGAFYDAKISLGTEGTPKVFTPRGERHGGKDVFWAKFDGEECVAATTFEVDQEDLASEYVEASTITDDGIYVSAFLKGDRKIQQTVTLLGTEFQVQQGKSDNYLFKIDPTLTRVEWVHKMNKGLNINGLSVYGDSLYVAGAFDDDVWWGVSKLEPFAYTENNAFWGTLDKRSGEKGAAKYVHAGYAEGKGVVASKNHVYMTLWYGSALYWSDPDNLEIFFNDTASYKQKELMWPSMGLCVYDAKTQEFLTFTQLVEGEDYIDLPKANPVISNDGGLFAAACQTGDHVGSLGEDKVMVLGSYHNPPDIRTYKGYVDVFAFAERRTLLSLRPGFNTSIQLDWVENGEAKSLIAANRVNDSVELPFGQHFTLSTTTDLPTEHVKTSTIKPEFAEKDPSAPNAYRLLDGFIFKAEATSETAYSLTVNAEQKGQSKVEVLRGVTPIAEGANALFAGDTVDISVQVLGHTYTVAVTGANEIGAMRYEVTGDVTVNVTYTKDASLWKPVHFSATEPNGATLAVTSQYMNAEIADGDELPLGDLVAAQMRNRKPSFTYSLDVVGGEFREEHPSTVPADGPTRIFEMIDEMTITPKLNPFKLTVVAETKGNSFVRVTRNGGLVVPKKTKLSLDDVIDIEVFVLGHEYTLTVDYADKITDTQYRVKGNTVITVTYTKLPDKWHPITFTKELKGTAYLQVRSAYYGEPVLTGTELAEGDTIEVQARFHSIGHKYDVSVEGAQLIEVVPSTSQLNSSIYRYLVLDQAITAAAALQPFTLDLTQTLSDIGAKVHILRDGKELKPGVDSVRYDELLTLSVYVLGHDYSVIADGAEEQADGTYKVVNNLTFKLKFYKRKDWHYVLSYDASTLSNGGRVSVHSDYFDKKVFNADTVLKDDTLRVQIASVELGKSYDVTATGAQFFKQEPSASPGETSTYIFIVEADVTLAFTPTQPDELWKTVTFDSTGTDTNGQPYVLTVVNASGEPLKSGDKVAKFSKIRATFHGAPGVQGTFACTGAEVDASDPSTFTVKEDAVLSVSAFQEGITVPLSIRRAANGKILVYRGRQVDETKEVKNGGTLLYNEEFLVVYQPNPGAELAEREPPKGATNLEGDIYQATDLKGVTVIARFVRSQYTLTIENLPGVQVEVKKDGKVQNLQSASFRYDDRLDITLKILDTENIYQATFQLEGAEHDAASGQYLVKGNMTLTISTVAYVKMLLTSASLGGYTVSWMEDTVELRHSAPQADSLVRVPMGGTITLDIVPPAEEAELVSIEPKEFVQDTTDSLRYTLEVTKQERIKVVYKLKIRYELKLEAVQNGTLTLQYDEGDGPQTLDTEGKERTLNLLENTQLSITATPAEHYICKQIQVGDNPTYVSGTNFKLDRPLVVRALFEPIQHLVKEIAYRGSGVVQLSTVPDGKKLSSGDTVCEADTLRLIITPAKDYRLREGSLQLEGLEALGNDHYLVVGAVSVKVDFEPIPTPAPTPTPKPTPTAVESGLLAEVSAVPNPCEDLLRVLHAENIRQYILYNALGVVVRSGEHTERTPELHLQLGDQPAGLYILRLRADDGEKILRILKQ